MEPEENLIICTVNTDDEEIIECVPDIHVDEFYENRSSLLYEEPIPDKNSFMKFLSNGSSGLEKELIELCDMVEKKVDEEVDQGNRTNGMTSIGSKTDDSKFFQNKIFSSCQGYSTTNSNVESPLASSKKCSNGENSKVKENGFKGPVVVSERKSDSSTKRKESQKRKVNTSNTTTNDGMDSVACSSKTLTEAEKIIVRTKLKSKKALKTVKNSKTNVINKRKKSLRSSGSFTNDKNSVTAMKNSKINLSSRDVINKRKKPVRRSLSFTSDVSSVTAMKNSKINLSSRDVINKRKKSVRRSLSFTSDISSVESETSQDKVSVTSDKEEAIIHCKSLRIFLIDIFKYPQDFFKKQLQENDDLPLVSKFIKTSHADKKLGNSGADANTSSKKVEKVKRSFKASNKNFKIYDEHSGADANTSSKKAEKVKRSFQASNKNFKIYDEHSGADANTSSKKAEKVKRSFKASNKNFKIYDEHSGADANTSSKKEKKRKRSFEGSKKIRKFYISNEDKAITQDKNLNIIGLVSAMGDSTVEEAGVPNQVVSKPMFFSSSGEFSKTPRSEHMEETRVINEEETTTAGEIIKEIKQQNTLLMASLQQQQKMLQQQQKMTSILERIEENTKVKNSKL